MSDVRRPISVGVFGLGNGRGLRPEGAAVGRNARVASVLTKAGKGPLVHYGSGSLRAP